MSAAGSLAATIAELMELATGYFDRAPPQVVAPGELEEALGGRDRTASQEAAIERSARYFPYQRAGRQGPDR